eukprot:gene24104-3357_t
MDGTRWGMWWASVEQQWGIEREKSRSRRPPPPSDPARDGDRVRSRAVVRRFCGSMSHVPPRGGASATAQHFPLMPTMRPRQS